MDEENRRIDRMQLRRFVVVVVVCEPLAVEVAAMAVSTVPQRIIMADLALSVVVDSMIIPQRGHVLVKKNFISLADSRSGEKSLV